MQMTRNEILTKFDENWFHNHSLFGLKEILRIYNNAYINGETFLTRKEQKNVKKSIKSILRNTNRNKYVSTKDLKVVLDFAEWCAANILVISIPSNVSTHFTQQEIDGMKKEFDELFCNIFQVQLYLSAKLYPNVKTYNINDTIEPVVSNSTVSIHV